MRGMDLENWHFQVRIVNAFLMNKTNLGSVQAYHRLLNEMSRILFIGMKYYF